MLQKLLSLRRSSKGIDTTKLTDNSSNDGTSSMTTETPIVLTRHPERLSSRHYQTKSKKSTFFETDALCLIPHEWHRHEMQAAVTSVQALADTCAADNAWQALNFARWLAFFLTRMLNMYYENKHKVFHPFLRQHKVQDHHMDDKVMTRLERVLQDEESLLRQVNKLACTIMEQHGMASDDTIAKLKQTLPELVKEVDEIFYQEEKEIPAAMRAANITKEELDQLKQDMIDARGVDALHTLVPGILVNTQQWATQEYYQTLEQELLGNSSANTCHKVLIPNYKNIHCALRDSPILPEKPEWTEIPMSQRQLSESIRM